MDVRRHGQVFVTGIILTLLGATLPANAQLGSGMGGGNPLGGGKDERPKYRPPVIERSDDLEPVVSVDIVGNRTVTRDKILATIATRPGRGFDPEIVQADVRKLSTTGWFQNVRTYRKPVPGGVAVTFEVFELPRIQYIKFVGNKKESDRKLLKKCELKEDEPLHRYRVEEAKRRLEEYYTQRGYGDAEIEIEEGITPESNGVVFAIYEGQMQRVWKTKFVGNTFVSAARLKTQIESKPGILYFYKGKVDKEQIDEDVNRLYAYYRSFGYFKARISRTLEFGDSGKWLSITFVIDEGPRYQIRNVSIVGNQNFTTESLAAQLELRSGEMFDAQRMNMDLNALRDAYGSQGYIHADVQADPRFLEEPGQLDLVYNINEGEAFRAGRIIVNIEGENPHTRSSVVLNRMSIKTGDILDIREIRASERRIGSSQIFMANPAMGVMPSIEIRAPEVDESYEYANQPASPNAPRMSQNPQGRAPRY
ncbi:MAG: POTRA domain-containing protein [Pirellulaceae bacterium]